MKLRDGLKTSNPRQSSSGILDVREENVPVNVPRCTLVACLTLLFATSWYCGVSLHLVQALVCVSLQPRQEFNILPNMVRTTNVELDQIVQRRRMAERKKCVNV